MGTTNSKRPIHPLKLCWFSVVAGVTGLIRGICAVKTVKIVVFVVLPFLPGGHLFFVYHIRGKNVKIENVNFLTFLPAGHPFFLAYPR